MLDAIFTVSLIIMGLSVLCFIAAFVLEDYLYNLDDLVKFASCIIFIIALVTMFVVAIISDSQHKRKLMVQCLADGKKEYECYNMLKQDVVPVFIPIPTGR